jgi:mono/diheme cytochrome c family protein
MVSPSRGGGRKTFGGAQLLRALCFVAGSSAAAASSPLAAQTSEGKEVFKLACVACHGEDGRGGPGGGAPLEKVTDATMVAAMVTDGRGNMPPLAEALTAEQIRAVAAYVVNGLFEQKSP